jgi:hypothetical protein
MVLERERCTEERHDAVAHHLVHRALVVMDRFHHPLEHRIKELAGLLGVTVSQKLHGAFQIGEQNRDLLALALERGLGGQDLLGQVLGRVGLRRCGLPHRLCR